MRFAVYAAAVREITRTVAVAPLPGAPSIVEGVINYRGRVAVVLDIRGRFALPARPLDVHQHVVVADTGARLVAFRVDRALELVTVPADAIESAARVAPGTRHADGIARLTDGVIVIHDLERFLSAAESALVDRAVSEAGSAAVKAGEA